MIESENNKNELSDKIISEIWEYKDDYVECYYSCSEEGKFYHSWVKFNDVTYRYTLGEITNIDFKPGNENKVNLKRANAEFTRFMSIKNSTKPTSIYYKFDEYCGTAVLNPDYVKIDDFRVLKYFPNKDVFYRGVMIKKEQLNE